MLSHRCDAFFRRHLHEVVAYNGIGVERVREEDRVTLRVNHAPGHHCNVHSVRHVCGSEVSVGICVDAGAKHHRCYHARLTIGQGIVAQVELIYESLAGAIE